MSIKPRELLSASWCAAMFYITRQSAGCYELRVAGKVVGVYTSIAQAKATAELDAARGEQEAKVARATEEKVARSRSVSQPKALTP